MVLFAVSILSVFFLANLASGQVMQQKVTAEPDSRYLEYEGVLSNVSGESMNGGYRMTFRIYDSSTGDVVMWEKTHRVKVNDGEFKAILGKKSRIPVSDEVPYHIGITINGDELSPRQPVMVRADDKLVKDSETPPVTDYGPGAVGPPTGKPIGVDLDELDDRYVNEGQDSSITSAMIVDGTITSIDIANNAIYSHHIIADGVEGEDIAAGAVGMSEVGTNAVGQDEIIAEGVGISEIAAGAVTMPKINASGAVSGDVIKWTGTAWEPVVRRPARRVEIYQEPIQIPRLRPTLWEALRSRPVLWVTPRSQRMLWEVLNSC